MAMKIKVTAGSRAFDIFNYTFVGLLCLSIIYPFWTIILQAFSPVDEVYKLGLHIWLEKWSVDSWKYVFKAQSVGLAYFNTLHRTIFGTLFTLLVTFTGAYALSKRTLPGRSYITFLYVFTMFFSGGLIPTYLIIRGLGLMNTRLVLIIPMGINVFYIIIARNFLMTIDQAMVDSAVIDGAGYWTVLFRIMLPLSKPVLATIALWTAVSHWNQWFDALIYINKKELRVLQLLIRDMITKLLSWDEIQREMMEDFEFEERLPPEAVQAATILITIGPIILVYPFAQKYFVKGVLLGSLKG